MSESKVRVAVRVRPLLSQEKTDRATSCVDVMSASEVVVGDKQFTFDHVFGPESRQSEFYCECVSSLIDNLFEGYNATVFAYGQTGSGKTHTMGSGCFVPPSSTEDEFGVIPQAVKQIFDTIAARKCENSGNEYYLRVQFLELYGETLKDLLDPVGSAQGKKIQIRDGEMNSMQIVGAVEESVKTLNETLLALERGTLCRTTGSTAMNTHSSRSHAIFTIILEQQVKASSNDDAETEFRISKFHMVDLAGSERAKRTGASGVRLREGIDINKGLLALGNVISALGSDESSITQERFVNYRDSKLTRILQDSLGGNSRTLMITCVSPADSSFEETLNALRYANRARNIKNKAVINRDPASSLIASLKAEVARLKQQLTSAGVETKTNNENSTVDSSSLKRSQADTSSTSLITGNLLVNKLDQDNINQQFFEDEIHRLNLALESETKIRRTMEERVAVLEAERLAILGDVLVNESDEDGEEVEDDESNLKNSSRQRVLMMNNLNSPNRRKNIVQNHKDNDEETDVEEESDVESLVLLSPSGRSVPYVNIDDEHDDVEEEDEASRELKRKFEQSQRTLRQLASKYDATLASKQQVMRQIEEERARFEAFKIHFESKMREMNEEVRHVKQQREQLRAKLAELEKVIPATAKSTADAALIRIQMAEKDSRLRELEDNGRQLELTRKAALEWQKKEAQVRAEIEMVKREKAELQKKMNENQKRHVEELNERRLEIAGLERERARLEHDTSLLSAQVSRDTKVIQAKSAQVAAMQKKLREAMRISTSRLSGKEASAREKQQRAEIERLAALQVQREEELLALRRALAKKELAILRRNRLLEKLKLVREEELKRSSASPQNMALEELVPLGATKEDIAELENRLEALNSEILFRDRECMIALAGSSGGDNNNNSEVGTNNNDPADEEGVTRDVDQGEKVINTGSAVLSLQSMDDAKEVCRVLMAMFVEGKRENRELRKDVERLNDALEEEAIRALVERRRTEALLLSAESAVVVRSSSSSSVARSSSSQHLSPKKRTLVDVDNKAVPERPSVITTSATTVDEERLQTAGSNGDDDDAQSRIASLEKKLKSLQARPLEEEDEEEGTADERMESATTSRGGTKDLYNETSANTVFARLTSPSALTGIHKYGQRERLSLQRARRSQWVIRKDPPAASATESHDPPQQQQQQEASSSPSDCSTEDLGLNTLLIAVSEGEQDQSCGVSVSQQQQQQQKGWERVAAQTTESFSHKRSSAVLGTGKKKSSWRSKRATTPPKSPSVSPASFIDQQQQMKATSPRKTSNKVPVYERLSDPRSFTGTQRHIHNQFYSSIQSE